MVSENPTISDGAIDRRAPFFAVGQAKLLVLSVTTLNLYQVLWFYQHWRHRRDVLGETVRPAARSLFAWVYVFALGRAVGRAGTSIGLFTNAQPLLASALWVVGLLGARLLPDGPVAILSLMTVAPLMWLQALANRVNRAVAPGHAANTRFTRANVIVACIGAIVLAIAVYGLTLPDHSITVEEHF